MTNVKRAQEIENCRFISVTFLIFQNKLVKIVGKAWVQTRTAAQHQILAAATNMTVQPAAEDL